MISSTHAPLVQDGSRNAQLEHAVCRRLGRSGYLGLLGIDVKVDNDRIVLSGTVHSYYLKQLAQEAARQACPNRKLYNGLDVVQAN